MQWLSTRDWPGNVRELRNSIHRGLLLSEGNEIYTCHLQAEATDASDESEEGSATINLPFRDAKTRTVARFEHDYLCNVLRECHGNITQAAQRAQTERSTLARLLKKHELDYRDFMAA